MATQAVSALGILLPFPYRPRVIGFLRFVGILNAAIWLGTAIFFTFGAGPAAFSSEMHDLIGPKNYPYFSSAIAQILLGRLYLWQLACGFVAVLHLLAEWLYLGRTPNRAWVGLMAGVVALGLFGSYWVQPKMREWHNQSFAVNARPDRREAAAHSFQTWQNTSQVVNLLLIAGLSAHLWRMAGRAEATRFVSSSKFRS
jgi:hypothetical protein